MNIIIFKMDYSGLHNYSPKMSHLFGSHLMCGKKMMISDISTDKGALSKAHLCCQQGHIIPIRLLKSDYVACLQIKNSPGHLWYLEQKRATRMISNGHFLNIHEVSLPHQFIFNLLD